MNHGLSAQEIADYNQNGFVFCGRVYDDDALAAIRQVVDRRIEAAAPEFSPDQIFNHHFTDGALRALASDPILLDRVESLIGPKISIFTTRILCKMPGAGAPIPWHQDSNYWPLDPMKVVTCWLALDDVDLENGAMEFIPGSHTLGNLPAATSTADDGEAFFLHLDESSFDAERRVAVELEAGGLSLHDGYMIHRSLPNESARRRSALIIRYVPSDVQIVPNDFALFRDGYAFLPVRGEPVPAASHHNP